MLAQPETEARGKGGSASGVRVVSIQTWVLDSNVGSSFRQHKLYGR